MEKSKNSLSARRAWGGGLQTPPHEFQKIKQKVFETNHNRKYKKKILKRTQRNNHISCILLIHYVFSMINDGFSFFKNFHLNPLPFVSSPPLNFEQFISWSAPGLCVAIGNAVSLLIQFLVTSLTWLDFLERKFHFVPIFTLPKNHVQQNSTISSILITGKKYMYVFELERHFKVHR